jgi:hypothetical protein
MSRNPFEVRPGVRSYTQGIRSVISSLYILGLIILKMHLLSIIRLFISAGELRGVRQIKVKAAIALQFLSAMSPEDG